MNAQEELNRLNNREEDGLIEIDEAKEILIQSLKEFEDEVEKISCLNCMAQPCKCWSGKEIKAEDVLKLAREKFGNKESKR